MKPNAPDASHPFLSAALFGLFLASAHAEPFAHTDACFVRAEPRPAASASNVVPAATESRLGIRRKAEQLFDVELAVVGPEGTQCAVAGVARLRPGEVLVLPVRPDSTPGTKPAATPCLVSLRAASQSVEISTTEAACQAQSLCAGRVQLHGQRFELATRVPTGGRNPCFATASP